MSPPARAVTIVIGAVQIGLFLAANLDITRRPAAEIRGASKARWRLICLLNTIGPLSYFRWGRIKPAADGAPGGTVAAPARDA